MRDLLDVERELEHVATGATDRDLGALLRTTPSLRRAPLDPLGVLASWSERPEAGEERTFLRGIRRRPRASWGPLPEPSRQTLEAALVEGARASLGSSRRPIVALGGGLDAPLAVLAARRAGIAVERAITVAVAGTAYDESRAARAAADALGLELTVVELDVDDLVAGLGEAVRHATCAIYNLHPVSRLFVARSARARGADALLTGDGADQALRAGRDRADYVPLVAAITRGVGLAWATPFAHEHAAMHVAASAAAGADPKAALRALAIRWGLPPAIAGRSKSPAWAPPLPRSAFPPPARVARLARALDMPLAWSASDRRNVGIASLDALVQICGIEV